MLLKNTWKFVSMAMLNYRASFCSCFQRFCSVRRKKEGENFQSTHSFTNNAVMFAVTFHRQVPMFDVLGYHDECLCCVSSYASDSRFSHLFLFSFDDSNTFNIDTLSLLKTAYWTASIYEQLQRLIGKNLIEKSLQASEECFANRF